MKYSWMPKFEFEEETYPEAYFEIGEKRNYERVLIILPDKKIGSTFPFYISPFTNQHEMTVPEGMAKLSEEELQEIEGIEFPEFLQSFPDPKPINREQFEDVWSRYLDEWREYWEYTKSNFKVGQITEGVISIFYFNGPVIRFSQNVYGIIPDEEYQKAQNDSGIVWRSGTKILAKVSGYDDINMWLKIEYQGLAN